MLKLIHVSHFHYWGSIKKKIKARNFGQPWDRTLLGIHIRGAVFLSLCTHQSLNQQLILKKFAQQFAVGVQLKKPTPQGSPFRLRSLAHSDKRYWIYIRFCKLDSDIQ